MAGPEVVEAVEAVEGRSRVEEPGPVAEVVAVSGPGPGDAGPVRSAGKQRTPARRAAHAASRKRRRREALALARERGEVVDVVIDDAVVEQVRAFVAARRAETGLGPRWVELSRHMGWTREQGAAVCIPALVRARVLTHTREPGSLDLGPATRLK